MVKKLISGIMSVVMLTGSCCAVGAQSPAQNIETKKSVSVLGGCKKAIAAGVVAASAMVAGSAYCLTNRGSQNIGQSKNIVSNEDGNIIMDYANADENFVRDFWESMKNYKNTLTVLNVTNTAVSDMFSLSSLWNVSSARKDKYETFGSEAKSDMNSFSKKGTMKFTKTYDKSKDSVEERMEFKVNGVGKFRVLANRICKKGVEVVKTAFNSAVTDCVILSLPLRIYILSQLRSVLL